VQSVYTSIFNSKFLIICMSVITFLFLGVNWAFDILAEELEENVVDPPPHDQVAR
jgi:hypothetical protein